jgi:hypothetical protein
MKMNKKGAEKYYILISLILGILLIGITFSWIFSGYLFDEEAMELQKCKQSILARSTIPDNLITRFTDLKEKFPLECKTKVIEINEENTANAEKIIANAITACWALYDRGEAELFSSSWPWQSSTTACFTCARIHFTEASKSIISTPIDTKKMLEKTMDDERTYLDYLTSNGQNKYLFHPNAFETQDFTITETKRFLNADTSTIQYPKTINPEHGDLHITLASWVLKINGEIETENNIFFYQNAEQNLKKISGISATPILNDWGSSSDIDAVCGHWDGINIA